jgi:N-succinyldiaminopimelate aminotransferase
MHPLADLSIGEPQHAPTAAARRLPRRARRSLEQIPAAAGTPAFRAVPPPLGSPAASRCPCGWLEPDRHILPVAGTKEALFLVAAIATDPESRGGRPAVLMPNPLYSTYQGAAILAGAEPMLMPALAANGFPARPRGRAEAVLARTTCCYLCTPANPQGVVADRAYLERALDLARAPTTSCSSSTSATRTSTIRSHHSSALEVAAANGWRPRSPRRHALALQALECRWPQERLRCR